MLPKIALVATAAPFAAIIGVPATVTTAAVIAVPGVTAVTTVATVPAIAAVTLAPDKQFDIPGLF